jgi:hypothetical protein
MVSNRWYKKESENIVKTSIRAICGVGLVVLSATIPILAQRNVHRPKDNTIQTIAVSWADEPEPIHTLTSRYLEKNTLFELFDRSFFYDHLLPKGKISFRYNPEQTVDSTLLDSLIEKAVQEIRNGRRTFSDFTILRDRDFNHKRLSGLIILKCNNFPFVVKLFMENPKSFVRPFRKGIVPSFCFFIGGGINRHLSGFTRIKNLYAFKEIVDNSPLWSDTVTLPRKWFWLPHDSRWFAINGTNFGPSTMEKTSIPGTYAIVADAIEIERTMSLRNKRDRKESLRLCNDVNFCVDPHIDNFMIEKGSGKIAVIDTEDFGYMTGRKDKDLGHYNSQIAWYVDLSLKAARDIFFRPKITTAAEPTTPVPPIIRKKTRKYHRWIYA